MKTTTLKTDVRFKDGTTFAAGTTVEISWEQDGKIHATIEGRSFNVSGRFLNKTKGFKVPSMKTLERWADDCICKTITGKTVEPDGYGCDGSPSWLLALRMI